MGGSRGQDQLPSRWSNNRDVVTTRAGLEGQSCSTVPRMFLDTVWPTPPRSSNKTDVIATRWSRGPVMRSLIERDSRRAGSYPRDNRIRATSLRCAGHSKASRATLDTFRRSSPRDSQSRLRHGQAGLETVEKLEQAVTQAGCHRRHRDVLYRRLPTLALRISMRATSSRRAGIEGM